MKNTHTDPNKTHRAHKNNQPTNRNSPASSSDSDSSDEDVPVARKPAGATMGAGASKSMTPATKGVVSATGGKGLSAAVASSKRPAVSSSDSDSSDEEAAPSSRKAKAAIVSKPTTPSTKGVVAPNAVKGTPVSASKRGAASSSDSDSSDEDVPVARKPAGATMGAGASKSMTPATKGVVSATGGKGLSAAVASSKRPAVSSSDSDSSDEEAAPSSRKAKAAIVSKPTTPSTKGVVAPNAVKGTPVSASSKRPAVSSSDWDTRVEDIPAVKKDTRRVGESSDVVFGSQNGSCGKRSFMTSGLPSDAKRHKLDVSDMVDVDSGRRSLPAVSDTWNGVNSSEKCGSLSGHKSRQSFPFRRVPDDIELIDPQLSNNSYEAKPNSRGAWGERAYKDFQFTSGKSFKHEKTKKKRGNYAGGTLSTAVSSYKFDD